ncbi:UBC-like protein [Delitschia confertaspora ATCC 74209]|uniref:UBC-like protein n=1 Tax=Delitschia confertaspora ATCC 74209 TaxID=1513339 RepID=A0A9P4JMS2_9PLEO|nr:UBC-like protein [Delitschia confertaspora ATCC 74209]
MSNQSILRITRELGEIQRGSDLSLAVACRDIDVRQVRALIIGPPDTPYEFGFFEFAVKFTKEYPTKAPSVTAVTTNLGRTRFNPNIYAAGRVCLSILGTWRGERGEEWSSAQGLESILISIQSLMSSNPYENEPGFEDANSDYDKKNQEAYVAKIRHETLRISVIERLEDYLGIGQERVPGVTVHNVEEDYKNGTEKLFEPFKDLCKRRFLWYYESYLQSIEREAKRHKDGDRFEKMPFEGPGNSMDGTFQYSSLKERLQAVYEKLNEETLSWAIEGQTTVQKEMSIASNLQRQFEQIVENYKENNDSITLDLELVDKNPFVWQLVIFGRPMTNLDGGIFRIMIYLSPKFPNELPRIKFETPIFHHRISKNGVLCYNPTRKDDMKSHIESIIEAIEEESPAYDPRTLVNPEAAKLFWGTADDKKIYNRRLRRSVQDSADFC